MRKRNAVAGYGFSVCSKKFSEVSGNNHNFTETLFHPISLHLISSKFITVSDYIENFSLHPTITYIIIFRNVRTVSSEKAELFLKKDLFDTTQYF